MNLLEQLRTLVVAIRAKRRWFFLDVDDCVSRAALSIAIAWRTGRELPALSTIAYGAMVDEIRHTMRWLGRNVLTKDPFALTPAVYNPPAGESFIDIQRARARLNARDRRLLEGGHRTKTEGERSSRLRARLLEVAA